MFGFKKKFKRGNQVPGDYKLKNSKLIALQKPYGEMAEFWTQEALDNIGPERVAHALEIARLAKQLRDVTVDYYEKYEIPD